MTKLPKGCRSWAPCHFYAIHSLYLLPLSHTIGSVRLSLHDDTIPDTVQWRHIVFEDIDTDCGESAFCGSYSVHRTQQVRITTIGQEKKSWSQEPHSAMPRICRLIKSIPLGAHDNVSISKYSQSASFRVPQSLNIICRWVPYTKHWDICYFPRKSLTQS